MRNLKYLIPFLVFTMLNPVQAADMKNNDLAIAAFAAFEIGEGSGDYTKFKAMLSDEFNLYSHPVYPSRGVFTDAEAKSKINELIAQREKTPNILIFSDIKPYCSGDTCLFQFNSEGKGVGGFPYKGYNVISLTMTDGKVSGFREYLGDVDPLWFK